MRREETLDILRFSDTMPTHSPPSIMDRLVAVRPDGPTVDELIGVLASTGPGRRDPDEVRHALREIVPNRGGV